MKNIGGIAPKIQAENLAFIGLRDLEKQEIELMERTGLKNISVDELREAGVKSIIDQQKRNMRIVMRFICLLT